MIRDLSLGTAAIGVSRSLIGQTRPDKKRMGVVITSYMQRRRQKNQKSILYPPFKNALEFIEHCHRTFNAGGVQIGVGGWSKEFSNRVRERCERYRMFLEGQISLPKDEADLGRFETEVVNAKNAGATVHRAALGGRRYEVFDRQEAFESARQRAWARLRLAEPIAAKH